jgi:hypothetical protein
MQIPVLIEPIAGNGYRARGGEAASHCPLAWRMDSLRAAEKLSGQGRSKMRAPCCWAISLVESPEPVSTTMISSTRSRTEARQRPSVAASFLTIIVIETRAVMVKYSVGCWIF